MNNTVFSPKILIVDDYPANLVAMKKLLSACDAELHTASSGKEALALVAAQSFSLLLLDVQLPVMNGFEMAEIIRSDHKNATIPIIFLTAESTQRQDIFQGYESGAVDYIIKPFEPEILLSKVNFFLELSRQKNEKEKASFKLLQEIQRRRSAEEEKDKLIETLENALSEIKTLQGILPICAKCKSIRNDEGLWQKVENYISDHSEAEFSHGLCESCCQELYGKEEWYKKEE